jgi:hypothetical protein
VRLDAEKIVSQGRESWCLLHRNRTEFSIGVKTHQEITIMSKSLRNSVFAALLLSLCSVVAWAQAGKGGSMNCNNQGFNDRLVNHCEIREQTIAATGLLNVDARQNGGVAVKGWDRQDVLVRSKVQASSTTQAGAEQLAKQVRVETAGGKIFAEGPTSEKDNRWSVSYEIFVPRRTDLSLQAHNGGIVISEVSGRLDFTAMNGGVVLRRVGGAVKGSTTNGGVVIELSGNRWDGEALDVRTTNGGIVMSVPENYSAHLQTGTVNGNLSIDFPVTVQGRITREIAVNLGAGGQTVRAMTTNGGIKIKRVDAEN